VVAIGKTSSSSNNNKHKVVTVEQAPDYIYGFAVGIDFTRRDLQSHAQTQGLPWDTAKYFDQSAPMGSIHKLSWYQLLQLVEPRQQQQQQECRLELYVNGQRKQSANPLQDMIWNIPQIISQLSSYYQLRAGDLIMTGTPAGVGPVQVGDHIVGRLVMKRKPIGNNSGTSNEEGDGNVKDILDPVDIVLV
jgi:fumarylpyruvate hydrolase